MNTTHKLTRTRCAEHPLTHTEAQDFQRSLYVAGALLERAWQGNAETPERTVVVTAPGGRVLAHVRGTRATFTAPITITGSIEAAGYRAGLRRR